MYEYAIRHTSWLTWPLLGLVLALGWPGSVYLALTEHIACEFVYVR